MERRTFGRPAGVLPGFGLSVGYTVFCLGVVVLLPLAALLAAVVDGGRPALVAAALDPRALASYRLTFGAALAAALVDLLFGFVVAWTLVRYRFVGRRVLDALVDLPFALPTAVSGIALTTLYAPNGLLGRPLAKLGVDVAFTPLGIGLALVFVGLPFVVRTLQPALADIEAEVEEAAASLGASRGQTFRRVLLPGLAPALLTGFALALARGLGEYGSVVFIAGNRPMRTEVTALLIVGKLEQFDDAGAAALATVMLAASFALLLAINALQGWARRRIGGGA